MRIKIRAIPDFILLNSSENKVFLIAEPFILNGNCYILYQIESHKWIGKKRTSKPLHHLGTDPRIFSKRDVIFKSYSKLNLKGRDLKK